jgi:hypothetical protein
MTIRVTFALQINTGKGLRPRSQSRKLRERPALSTLESETDIRQELPAPPSKSSHGKLPHLYFAWFYE